MSCDQVYTVSIKKKLGFYGSSLKIARENKQQLQASNNYSVQNIILDFCKSEETKV